VIDEFRTSKISAGDIIKEAEQNNEGSTTLIRWGSWFMSVFGHYLLFTPLIKLLAWIPLLGWLLSSVLAVAVVIFALIWASLLHFIILGASWLVYRPLFGALFLGGAFLIIVLMMQGEGLTDAQVAAQEQPSSGETVTA